MTREPYLFSLEELKKAYPRNHPNPCVGAVVYQGKTLIGRGYTKEYPGFHAEVNAIESVKDKSLLKGATLYATLMPCSHYGKTPPCTEKIVSSGIKKVVVALKDPNPLVWGKSEEILASSGITLERTYPEDIAQECYRYNETFFARFLKKETPFVTLKYAMTLDGKMADYLGESKWISNESSRKIVHQLRSCYDGILVGEGTVLRDNPKLTARGYSGLWQPKRVILNCKKELERDKEVFSMEAQSIFLIRDGFSKDYLSFIESRGHLHYVVEERGKRMPLKEILFLLRRDFDVTSLLVEGGARVLGDFFNERAFDKVNVFISNKIIADGLFGLSPFSSSEKKRMKDSLEMKELSIQTVGGSNVLLSGYLSEESYFFSEVSK